MIGGQQAEDGGASSHVIFTSRLTTRPQKHLLISALRGVESLVRDVRMNEARCTFGESETSTTPALLSLFKAKVRIRQIKETELQFPVCVFDVTGQSKADSHHYKLVLHARVESARVHILANVAFVVLETLFQFYSNSLKKISLLLLCYYCIVHFFLCCNSRVSKFGINKVRPSIYPSICEL